MIKQRVLKVAFNTNNQLIMLCLGRFGNITIFRGGIFITKGF